MLFKALSAAVFGIDAYPVEVEVDISAGLPNFTTVGLPDAAVRESRERIKSAIKNCGLDFPFQNITVNLAPADVKKEGSGFDLPIALGILGTTGVLLKTDLKNTLFLGELSLDGGLRPIKGALSIAAMARQKGIQRMVLPVENACEAAVVEELQVYGLRSLPEVVDFINETREFTPAKVDSAAMLAQAKKPALDASPGTLPPSVATAATPPPAPATAQAAPAAPTYVAAAPTYVPASTVYVAPYPTTSAYYYNDYWPYYYGRPYYGPYWGYPRSSVSFSFGFGGHGGGFHGGGFHGGHR